MDFKYAENTIYLGEDLESYYAIIRWKEHKDGVINIYTTRVSPDKSGQGLGGKITKEALDYARENSLKVFPTCSFVRSYIEKHPEYQDILYTEEEIPEQTMCPII